MSEIEDWIDFLYSDNSGYVYAPVRKSPSEWVPKFFLYPSEKQELLSWVQVWGHNADVFLAPAIFKEKNSTKKAVKGSSVVWVEFDGQTHLDLTSVPKPSGVIQSSKDNHFHIYWQIPFTPGNVVEEINRKLTYKLNADSSGWDCTQILRPPGTTNFKRNLPVTLKGLTGLVYDCSDFDGLPEVPTPPTAPGIESILDIHKVLALGKMPDKLWELIENPKDTVGERSTYLMYLGYSLAETGFSYEAVLSVLLYADEKVGKFVGRTDRLQRLSEIASRAIHEKGTKVILQAAVYSVKEILADETSIEFLWDPFVPEQGRLLVTGSPGVGKTLFTSSLGMHLALGRDYLGFSIPAPCRSLYVSLEMGVGSVKRQMQRQIQAFNAEELEQIDKLFRFVPAGFRLEFNEIAEHVNREQPNLVFVDSMFAIARGELSGEEEPRRILDFLDALREQFGVATCLVHHNRKPSEGNKKPKSLGDIYGNVQITARIDTALILFQEEGKDWIDLLPAKVRFDEVSKMKVMRDSHLHYEIFEKKPKDLKVNEPKHSHNDKPDEGPDLTDFGE